jgi:transposase
MQLSDHPDKVVKHRPERCGGCGKSLRRGEVTGTERRQVIDIPPVKAEVTEHQMLTVKCGCGCETRTDAPDGVPAPAQYGPQIMGAGIYLWHGQFLSRDRACQAISEMFGCAPAPGALAVRKTAGFLSPALAAITRRLITAGSRTSTRPGSALRAGSPGFIPRPQGSSPCSPCTPSAGNASCASRSQAACAT